MVSSNALLSLVVLVILLVGCGASRQSAYLAKKPQEVVKPAQAKDGQADPVKQIKQRAEAHWAKRESVGELRAALDLYKQALKLSPACRNSMSRLARGYYLLAYGHAKTDEKILAAYDEGAKWGERIMGLRPEFRKKVAEGEKDYEALSVAKKEDVPGIYWAYGNLGKWSVKQGFTTVLKNKSKLKAFIDRVTVLDEKYFHAGGHRGLGAFYAKAPGFAGGDLDKAEKHFKRSLEIAPNYYGTKVLMARYYAVKRQDKKLFKKLLDEVIAGDAAVLPDVIPIQKIEQRKARELLAKAEDLFE